MALAQTLIAGPTLPARPGLALAGTTPEIGRLAQNGPDPRSVRKGERLAVLRECRVLTSRS